MPQDASDSPTARFDQMRNQIKSAEEDGSITTETSQALQEWAKSTTKTRFRRFKHPNKDYKATSTIAIYGRRIRLTAQRYDGDFLSITPEEFNELTDSFSEGTHSDVQNSGLADGTVQNYQSANKHFFTYLWEREDPPHRGELLDPDDIHVYVVETQSEVDERDMFEEEEVEALRNACSNPRDRCLIELLIHTGQRVRAIQTIRLKDLDIEEGNIYLNNQAEGLKGAEKRGKKRPMWGARKYIRDWLNYHPCWNGPNDYDPEAYLITAIPRYSKSETGSAMTRDSINKALQRLNEEAQVNKPINPHNFRHYWVSTMLGDYDMDPDTVRMLMGHEKDSRSMEKIYNHLIADDYIQKAQKKKDQKEGNWTPEDEDKPLTPSNCPICGENLKSSWSRCPECNEVFDPKLEEYQENTNQALIESLAQSDDLELQEALVKFSKFLNENEADAVDSMEQLTD